MQLTQDEFDLFNLLPVDRTPIGNTSARGRLRWGRPRYVAARQGLLDKHLVAKGLGRGGSLRRMEAPDVEVAGNAIHIRPPTSERQMYEPILKTLRSDWAENRGFVTLTTERIADQVGKETGGNWTRPDLVAIGMKTFEYVPLTEFEVVTFEVKPLHRLNVLAVYEALGHRRAATHAYVLVELREELAADKREQLSQVQDAAILSGVGVITFDNPDDYETWDEVIPAQRADPRPDALNDFIRTQVPRKGREAVADAVERARHGMTLVPDR